MKKRIDEGFATWADFLLICGAVLLWFVVSFAAFGCGSSEPWTETECREYMVTCGEERGFGSQIECHCEIESECAHVFTDLKPSACEEAR